MPSPKISPEARPRGSPFAPELISHLQPYCTVQNVERGQRFDFQQSGQGICYLILEGSVAVYRSGDDLLLAIANAPAVFGLANLTDIYFDDYLKTVKPCKIGILTASETSEIIARDALWDLLSRHMMYVYNRLYHHIMPIGTPNAYEMIRHQLLELMSEDEAFRHSITAERYIRDKTRLSRSGVMRILADLKAGGYVEMEDGRLIGIHKLPAKY